MDHCHFNAIVGDMPRKTTLIYLSKYVYWKKKKYKLFNSSIFAKTVCLKHPTESHSAAEGKRAIL